jgi:hypothetical protein
MIFASDLDRTLIYSSKFINDSSNFKRVEAGDYPSYMTKRAAELLQTIARQITFIPSTTRTVEQYRRVNFICGLKPKYAVTSNGGNLLIDGHPDLEYKKAVQRQLQDCLPAPDILKKFKQITLDSWLIKTKEADGLFYYCLVDRPKVPLQELAQFTDWAAAQNWEVSLQGRKLYLVPKVINKWAPIDRILDIIGKTKVYTAGDSLLDLPLLTATQNHLCPRHGEVYQYYQKCQQWNGHKINFTHNAGIKAGEEVLETVMKWGREDET